MIFKSDCGIPYMLYLKKKKNRKEDIVIDLIPQLIFTKGNFYFIDYAKAFDCATHNKLWKILKEMGIPDHLTCL